ncbi:SsgA family sporulation/cell division regulator [Streptomyces sp. NPDC057445]|uniref:SsgA family sporulation/cell division regulator n=1 Tax=Streptomyces sp. NPDC057445 TaxID=3346136 RepID=UPI0036CA3E90
MPDRSRSTSGQSADGRLCWEAPVRHIQTPGISVPVRTTFSYDPDDPYTVQVTFRPAAHKSVTWDLSRDQLIAGTQAPSGMCDVRIWPVRADGDNRVHIRIGPAHACALFETDRTGLRAWLQQTCLIVPSGSESDRINWDTLTQRLLTDH